jgi:hypothetical protein
MKRVRKTEKDEERDTQREYHKAPNIFSFCVHLADFRDINDWPVSEEQSC